MLRLMPGLICYFDTDLRYIYANEAYARLRGHEPDAVIGLHCRDIVGPTNYGGIRAHLEKALNGISSEFEYDVVTASGKRRVLANYRSDIGPDGKVEGVLVLLTDLTALNEQHVVTIEQEALFEDAFLNSPIGMAVVDPLGRIVRANDSFATMLGRLPSQMANLPFADITHPDDLDADVHEFGEVLRGYSNGYTLDKRYIRTDGGIVETILSVSAMRNATGEIVCFISQVRDITSERTAARALAASNAQLSLAMEVVRGGFWHLDVAAHRFETSRQLAHYIEGPVHDSLDLDGYVAHIHQQDLVQADLTPLLEGQVERSVAQYRLNTLHGTRWMRCDRRLVRDEAGRPLSVVGVVIDVTEEHEQLEQSRAQADTDVLTGLLNRRGLQHRTPVAIGDRPWGVLAIDLDGFKQVNDIHGHAAGDDVLIETAARMLGAIRDGDLVARLGGDEFVIVLPGADLSVLDTIAARLVDAIRLPVRFGVTPLHVSCSIGAAAMDHGAPDLTEALKRADAALYDAKASGKNTWRIG